MKDEHIYIGISLASSYLTKEEFINCLRCNKELKKYCLRSSSSLSFLNSSSFSAISIAEFWNSLLAIQCLDNQVEEVIDYQIEALVHSIPELHAVLQDNVLRRDENLYGEINRDVIRTFHNHQLFHFPSNHGQEVLETVLRRLSDSYISLGYCQGMNYVAGAVMIAIVDSELAHYCDTNCEIVDKEKVCCQTFSILSKMISFLNLKSLWSYGFPAISRYSSILRSYLTEIHSQIPSHLDAIGFDFSILVARWFIPLFADSLPFPILFRCWSYLFSVGTFGLFRIAIAILCIYEQEILKCDLIHFSELMNLMCKEYLLKPQENQKFWKKVAELTMINENSLSQLEDELDKQKPLSEEQQKQLDLLTKDIIMIQNRVNQVSHDMVNEIHQLQHMLDKRNMITENVFSIQNEKLECCMKYDVLMSPINKNNDDTEEKLKEISERMRRLSDSLEEAVVTLEQARKCVDDQINVIEDWNTKRISFLKQLVHFYYERACIITLV